ncbi:DUF397 domain-containing protein [Streptomyces sp. NPDC052396]|uniref:DUF397 domain-containing protein n=1 Tax=Streptomyces sp. NPDC052396 TaxID=3365689 RepID=UPI0037D51619
MSAAPAVPAAATVPARFDALWRHSSYSTGMNNCVETARISAGTIGVRDSKRPAGPVLLLSPAVWTPFVRAVSGAR